MKLLLAGAWDFPIYEASTASALTAAGVHVIPYSWGAFHRTILARVGLKLGVDACVAQGLHRELADTLRRERPNVVMLWRPLFIGADGMRLLRAAAPDAYFVCYNNDNPYADSRRCWRPFIEAVPFYDLQLVYRIANLADARQAGAKRVDLWRAGYRRDVMLTRESFSFDELDAYASDAVFVGHYEPDERAEYLQALARVGIRVRLYGSDGWPKSVVKSIDPQSWPIRKLDGHDYAKAICAAKVALVFLSKLNADTYTRRCFEIPACGTTMVAPYTDDLAAMFEPEREAVFYTSALDLVRKVRDLVADAPRRDAIAAAGRARLLRDGHSVEARAVQLLELIASHGGPLLKGRA